MCIEYILYFEISLTEVGQFERNSYDIFFVLYGLRRRRLIRIRYIIDTDLNRQAGRVPPFCLEPWVGKHQSTSYFKSW